MYALGVDLGTTFTAASTWRAGHAEIASLGSRAASVPSVVLLREDETFLTGEPANRRGMSEPHRIAREFKRRFGDTTPILLGGVPYSAEALMARLLRWVVDEVADREGGPAAAVCVSYPANWGPYKTDLLRQAVRMADLEQPVSLTTEPEAAAVFYAHQQRIDPGAIVAVYDLGGGTFDTAVLRKNATGFEILGQPEGIERLGGIDFDAAVFNHVRRALGGKLDELDEDYPAAIAAVARLREECTGAKEALSTDTDASIPVLLPNVATEVRLTRGELEAMVRPALHASIEALRRALRSAGVTPDQLHSVLLVGGSSRMPIVAQLVGAELGRPVAVDAHPKHAVALGAAWLASASLGGAPAGGSPAGPPAPRATTRPTPSEVGGPAGPARPAPSELGGVAAGGLAAGGLGAGGLAAGGLGAGGLGAGGAAAGGPAAAGFAEGRGSPPPGARGVAAVPPVPAVPPGRGSARPDETAPGRYRGSGGGQPPDAGPPPAPVPPSGPDGSSGRRRRGLIAAGAALAVVLVAGGVSYALTREDPGSQGQGDGTGSQSPSAPPSEQPQVPADEQCTDEIKSNKRWVCLTKATFDGERITIEYEANFADASPNVRGGFHLHIYGGDGTDPPAAVMGTHAANPGTWYVEDKEPSVRSATSKDFRDAIGDEPKVCARIADSRHRLVPDNDGAFATGNCVPIDRP
jgi:actin-like ATPase involved in cell morphogenesis